MSITDYIKEDLIARIRNGQESEESLTLQSLSARYEVSITPVRLAVQALVKEGYLRKEKNRRLQINKRRIQLSGPEVKRPEPPKDYFDILKTDLIKLSLKGEEVYIREEATAQKFNISRSNVRHIFSRLVGFGFLEHFPRQGWKVRPFRQSDLAAFIDVRVTLELQALEAAKEKLDVKYLQEMLDNNQLPTEEHPSPRIDDRLHEYFIEQAGNPYITDFFERHGRYFEILFDWEGKDIAASTQTVEQHREILSALLENDWQRARNALETHIRTNHPVLKNINSSEPSDLESAAD